ncbi:MAG: hypothetical protein IJG87_05125 [Ruminococcus sp.]|nr:hypothetical protein [Ruminococcus sp.]
MFFHCFPNQKADVAMPPTVSISLILLIAIPVLTALITVVIILLVERNRKKRSSNTAETMYDINSGDKAHRQ